MPYPSGASGMVVSLVLDERGAVACVGTPEEGGKGGSPVKAGWSVAPSITPDFGAATSWQF